MRLILHSGTEKTGTTSIQSVLSSSRTWLKERGLHYPRQGLGKRNHHQFARDLIFPSSAHKAREFLRQAAIRAAPDEMVLISSEWLYSAIHNDDGNDYIQSKDYWNARKRYLADLADTCRGFDTEILIFLRRPDVYAESYYKTLIAKGTHTLAFDSFLSEFTPLFDYATQIALLRSFFRVKIVSYDAAKNDLIGTFFREIGFAVPPADSAPLNSSPDARLTLWMARRGKAGRSAARRQKRFSLAPVARQLYDNYGRSTLWRSGTEREAFYKRFANEFDPGFFPAVAEQPLTVAEIDEGEMRRITAAFRRWRLMSFLRSPLGNS